MADKVSVEGLCGLFLSMLQYNLSSTVWRCAEKADLLFEGWVARAGTEPTRRFLDNPEAQLTRRGYHKCHTQRTQMP